MEQIGALINLREDVKDFTYNTTNYVSSNTNNENRLGRTAAVGTSGFLNRRGDPISWP